MVSFQVRVEETEYLAQHVPRKVVSRQLNQMLYSVANPGHMSFANFLCTLRYQRRRNSARLAISQLSQSTGRRARGVLIFRFILLPFQVVSMKDLVGLS